MRNHRFGRRNIGILLCCMVGGWVLWYFWGPCQIVSIQDSLEVLPPNGYRKNWLAGDALIVVRPPSDLFTLREVLSDYDKKHPVDIELAEQKIKEMQTQRKDIALDAPIEYVRLFYKNTADTPLDWDGKRDEDKEGMEAVHRQDLIGSIRWMQDDAVKKYSCTKRIEWNIY